MIENTRRCPVCWRQIKFVQPSYILRDLIAKYGGEGGGPSRLKAELSHLSGDYDAPNKDDPVVVTAQFRPAHPGGCCACITGGAFDPADLYTIGGLEEFISVEEFLGTIKMVNQILSGWMPGSLKTCLGRSICWW